MTLIINDFGPITPSEIGYEIALLLDLKLVNG